MTQKQYLKKVDVARKYGTATLEDGCLLVLSSVVPTEWALLSKDGSTIDTATNPTRFLYLCD